MIVKNIPVTIEKAAPGENYDARFVMSASTPDRVRDTIEPSAYKSAVKIDKLIALWQHDPDRPIGYWTDLKAEADRLTGYIKFATTNLAQMAKTLIEDGVPLAASIGFRGKGEMNKDGGIHFKAIELLECSVVSVPAHPRAQQIAKNFGISPETLVSVTGDEEPSASSGNSPDALIRAKAAILAANRAIRK